MKPAVAKRSRIRGVVLVVTLQDVLATQDDLAQFAVRHFAIFFVDNGHLVTDRHSTRARTPSLIGWIESRATSRFRQAVTFDDETVKLLLKAPQPPRRHGRRATHRKPQLIRLQSFGN